MRLFSAAAKATSVVLLGAALAAPVAQAASKVDPALVSFGRGETTYGSLTIIGILNAPKSDDGKRPERYQTAAVLQFLKQRARTSWHEVEASLEKTGVFKRDVRLARLNWINSSFTAVVTPEGLRALTNAEGVKKIYSNRKVPFEKPRREGDVAPSQVAAGKVPYDFDETNLTKLISESPQITGKGVLIGSVDTGVDGTHPALAGKVATFYDGRKKKPSEARDYDSHGSHTAGTMVGGDRSKVLIGMAPEAKLVAAGPLDGYDMMLKEMEFMLDPDGNAETKDMPRAINNSWHCGGAPDIELFYRAIAAWEAAGILPVFSAGNAGPGTGTITPCHEHPGVIAIGATGPDGKLTNFSSRGPGKYKGKEVQKPDITAPGKDIVSTVPGGKFAAYSGTSMAAPHATGAAALLFQIDPKLTPAQVRAILVKTAHPTREDGAPAQGGEWNKMYGFGKMDIYAAVKAVLGVRKERRQAELGMLDLADRILTSPEKIDLYGILSDPGQIQKDDLEMPDAFDEIGTGWADAGALSR